MGVVIQGPWKRRPSQDKIEHEKEILARLIALSEDKRTEFPPSHSRPLPLGNLFR